MVRTPFTLHGHPRSRAGRSRPHQRRQTITQQNYATRYTYNERGYGKLHSCGTRITVYRPKENFPPLSLSHPNILDIYFNDYANRTIVCARRGVGFLKWLKWRKKPINKYRVDDANNKPKATSVRVCLRIMFCDILKAVCYINEEGFAIHNLSVENICVVDGVVKLWKLELVATSNEALMQNLISLHIIISKILQKSERKVPVDMKNLLALLKSSGMCNIGVFKDTILSHPSLMPPYKRLALVRMLFDMKWYSTVPSSNWRDATVDFFTTANLDDWNLKYKKKMVGFVLKCFNFRHVKNPYRVKMGASVQGIDVVEDFLNFLRNLSYHVGEGGEKARLSKKRMDGIIFWAFGKEILLFIECLKKQNLSVDLE